GGGARRAARTRIPEPFYAGGFEGPVGQLRQFVEATGYRTDGEKSGDGGWGMTAGKWERRPEHVWKTPGRWKPSDDEPVVHVSYNDAQAFCTWLGKREGYTYALPDQARWQHAARAGTTGTYGAEGDRDSLDEVAWIKTNLPPTRPGQPQPVGQKKPNAFGLHDTLGNVWEWCSDVSPPTRRVL